MLFGKHKKDKTFEISNSFVSFSGYLYIILGSIAGNWAHSSWLQHDFSPSEFSINFISFFGIDVATNALQNEFFFISELI